MEEASPFRGFLLKDKKQNTLICFIRSQIKPDGDREIQVDQVTDSFSSKLLEATVNDFHLPLRDIRLQASVKREGQSHSFAVAIRGGKIERPFFIPLFKDANRQLQNCRFVYSMFPPWRISRCESMKEDAMHGACLEQAGNLHAQLRLFQNQIFSLYPAWFDRL